MAIEIMDGGSVRASATLIIPRLAGEPIAAYAARGISGIHTGNPNAVIVDLDEPIDPANTQIHVTIATTFGSVIPTTPPVVSATTQSVLVILGQDARNCVVHFLVLAIRGPILQGENTIPLIP